LGHLLDLLVAKGVWIPSVKRLLRIYHATDDLARQRGDQRSLEERFKENERGATVVLSRVLNELLERTDWSTRYVRTAEHELERSYRTDLQNQIIASQHLLDDARRDHASARGDLANGNVSGALQFLVSAQQLAVRALRGEQSAQGDFGFDELVILV